MMSRGDRVRSVDISRMVRVEDHHEADEDADGTPQQIGGPKAEDHVLLAIDGAGCLLELVGIFEQGGDSDLFPVLGRSALGPWAVLGRGCRRKEGYAVAFDARDQVVTASQQIANHFAAGIVGIGHKVARLFQSQ